MTDSKPRGVVGRRHHPKTRTGCRTCKTRKVKCDEKRPACGNCIKHNVACEFLTSERENLPVSVPAQPRALDMQDLELLHNFTTRTCATLSDSLILVDFYRTSAVQYGLREEYIMRTLLSISASHLAYHRHDRQRHYQSLAMFHHEIAAKTAMELMTTSPTPSQAEGLFLFSVLTIFFALGCPRRDDKFLMVGESGFPHWMFLLQGTKAFTSSIVGSQTDTVLAPLLNHGADRWMARHRGTPGSKVHEHLDSIHHLIALRQPDARLRGIYAHAIEELQKSFSVLNAADPHSHEGGGGGGGRGCSITDAFVWIFEMATEFLPLLRDTTQEAVAIFSFFTVFLSKAGSQWCLHGWAEHLIGKCYALLDEEHRTWIQWPLEEMGWVC